MRDIRILLALLFVSHVSVAGTLPVTVVSAARIHTMDHEQPRAQAMAYDGDGRILALGGTAELLAR
jgi:predicted amidohydrolase YtcJ